jgi:hypothetical protein
LFAPAIIAVIVLLHSTGDASTTLFLLSRRARERNPIPRWFFKRLGDKGGPFVYFPLQALFLYLVYSLGYSAFLHSFGTDGAGWIVTVVSAVLATVPVSTNILATMKLKPKTDSQDRAIRK